MNTTAPKGDPMDALPKELRDKMEAAKQASAKPCQTCGAGVGKWCSHRVTK